MRLTVRLRFHTSYGQSLLITGLDEILGVGDIRGAVPLEYLDEQFWQLNLQLAPEAVPEAGIAYHYVLREADGSLIHEGGSRVINRANLDRDHLVIVDSWNDAGAWENAFFTKPFQQVLLKSRFTAAESPGPVAATHIFRVRAPLLEQGQTLCLLGSVEALGKWRRGSAALPSSGEGLGESSATEPRLLSRKPGEDWFSVSVDLGQEHSRIAYKYGVYDMHKRVFVRYEDGPDRMLDDWPADGSLTVIDDGFARLPCTAWKGAGVAIPVFSLRSESSFGVGEFTDIKLLVDWCVSTGLKLIQILPVNDTTATHTRLDSYPYSAISAFALHPLYLNLGQLGGKLPRELEAQRKRLNALEALDYETVIKAKLAFLRSIYPAQRARTFQSPEYNAFFEQNKHWLPAYATFCWLRDKYKTANFNQWPKHRTYRPDELAALTAKTSAGYEEIAFHYFTQFHLHRQLQAAAEYAHAHGVVLKGDVPIGVYPHSADVWQQPDLFHTQMQAGAPPDAFSSKGQNWGFPTYNWPRMKEDGFAWWKQRLDQMDRYFDAFRLDHILGFFRIWSIPLDAVEGILGHFVPAIPIHLDEFGRRGIRFDRDRYLKPYITDRVLADVFGQDARHAARLLQPTGSGNYSLPPEFQTQRKVEQFFASLEASEQNSRVKQGLLDLVSNVILLEVEGSDGEQFHFRFAIDKASSFLALDDDTRGRVWDLYVDYFFRRQDDFWRKEAMERLPALKRATSLLMCGEDLGLVPACVPDVMRQLGLLSLEIQRMPKDSRQEFSRPANAPYLSVVSPSTHDMSTIRGWWREDRAVTQRFFNQELGQAGEAPADCPPWVSQAIVTQHLSSSAMWSIFLLPDLLGMDEHLCRSNPDDERINVPANSQNYWRYRMHLTLEVLIGAHTFNEALKARLRDSGRM